MTEMDEQAGAKKAGESRIIAEDTVSVVSQSPVWEEYRNTQDSEDDPLTPTLVTSRRSRTRTESLLSCFPGSETSPGESRRLSSKFASPRISKLVNRFEKFRLKSQERTSGGSDAETPSSLVQAPVFDYSHCSPSPVTDSPARVKNSPSCALTGVIKSLSNEK